MKLSSHNIINNNVLKQTKRHKIDGNNININTSKIDDKKSDKYSITYMIYPKKRTLILSQLHISQK